MSLPPRVQRIVDELVQELKLQALRPASITINMDNAGIVQDVKPELVFRLGKERSSHASS